MAKIRIYELAKDLNQESKKLIEILGKKGIEVTNHMMVLDDSHVDMIKAELGLIQKTDGFKPKIKRIPKAQVAAEAAAAAKTDDVAPVEEVEAEAPKAEAEKVEAPKAEAKPEVKPEPKVEAPKQEEVKAEAPKAEPKQEEPKVEVKPEVKPEPKKEEPKAEAPKQVEKPAEAPRAAAPNARPNNERPQGNRPDNRDNRQQRDNRPDNRDNRQQRDNRPQGNRPDNRDNRQQRDNRPDNRDNRQQRDNRPDNRDNRQQRDNRPQGNRPDNRDNRPAAPSAPQQMRYTAPEPAPAPAAAKNNNRKQDAKKREAKEQTFYNDRNNGNEFGSKANRNRPKNKYKEQKKTKTVMPPVTPKKVVIGETIVLSELAKSMSKTASELIKKLFAMGIMATINQELDSETAILLADEFGVTVEVQQEKVDMIMLDDDDNPRDLKERPPVVTVMGHVDHGKTSLLDAIRKTSVTTTEAGGITQHIGAYQVEINNKKITFLDTPGHEAFTAMRARGAQATDIAILVVAADDGVMPQTVESINHSKAAGVPVIVAINKVDKPAANPDRVKQELLEYGLVCEDWGGDVIMVPVSAKTGDGIDNLLEMVLLVAEVAELKANPKRQARGIVIESKLDKNRGAVTTLLVQKGTLKIGETVIAGSVFGKIRAMVDDKKRTVKSAGPSMPVEVLGFAETTEPGEIFMAIKDERDARYAAQIQAMKKREEELRKSSRVSLDDIFNQIAAGDVKELNVVVKADVQGSAEAVKSSLEGLSTDEVKVKVIHVGVGGISEGDVMLADASNAIIIGFNVRPVAQATKAIEASGVDVRLYRVIYDAIEDVKKAMVGLLDPEFKERVIGHVEVRDTFKVPKVGTIAGAYVTDGKVTRQAQVRIIRDSIVIYEGKISSLKRFKDDAKEVMEGYECGIGIENYNDIKEGDQIEAFLMEETAREL